MSVASSPMPRMFMTEPQPTRAFEWTQAPWGAVLRCVPLCGRAPATSLPCSNLTLRDDAAEWESVAAAIGVAREDLLLVRQVHEATVAVASADRPRPWPRPEADAIVSNDPSAAIAVRVADCVPVLLAEETGRAVAAIHAGWRGIAQPRDHRRRERAAGDLRRAARAHHRGGRSVHRTLLLRGGGEHLPDVPRGRAPRLGARALVRAAAEGKFHLDLWRATRDQLEGAGVLPEQHSRRRAVHEDARRRRFTRTASTAPRRDG